jgi:putative MFS transporter
MNKAMTTKTVVDLYDEAPLTARFWVAVAILALGSIVDYFDFYIVGFILAVVGPSWHLTYGQSSVMLLSGGVGAIFGSVVSGPFADRHGRKPALIVGMIIAGASASAIALLPDGAWWLFAALRFFVGFGIAGAAAPSVALAVEYTPTRVRVVLSSLLVVAAGVGVMTAAAVATSLLSIFGWRGIAAVGILPVLVAFFAVFGVPESLRWMVATGQASRARKQAARLLRRPEEELPPLLLTSATARAPQGALREFLAMKRPFWLIAVIWLSISTANYGVYLWGPTVVALVLGIPVKNAAAVFIYVAFSGILGKIAFSFMPQWFGRRLSGQIAGLGMAITLGAAGLCYDKTLFGEPAFIILLVVGALFFDGAFANAAPYAAEVFPVRLAARGTGLSQAANGVGKILGPMSLALIAGTSNLLAPSATAAAVPAAFLFLAGCGLLSTIAFTVIPIETHDRPLDVGTVVESQSV